MGWAGEQSSAVGFRVRLGARRIALRRIYDYALTCDGTIVQRGELVNSRRVSAQLVEIDSAGGFVPLSQPPQVYLATPAIEVTDLKIGIEEASSVSAQEGGYCTVDFSGTFRSAFAAASRESEQTSVLLELVLNGNQHFPFRVPCVLTVDGKIERSYSGSFSFRLQNLHVTNGRNVFDFRIEDGIFAFFGECTWSAEFIFEPEEGSEMVPTFSPSVDSIRRSEAVVGREKHFYAVAVLGLTADEATHARLHIGCGQTIVCRLVREQGSERYIASNLHDDSEVRLALRIPDREYSCNEDNEVSGNLLADLGIENLSYGSAFLYGYYLSLLLKGVDFVADLDQCGHGAIAVSSEHKSLCLFTQLQFANGEVIDIASPISFPITELSCPSSGELHLGQLLAYSMELRRSRDPRARWFGLALSTGNLSKLGPEIPRAQGWMGLFLRRAMQALFGRLNAVDPSLPQIAGLQMGRVVAEALRRTSAANQSARIDRTTMASYLISLLQSTVFERNERTEIQSLVDRLTKLAS